MSDAHPVAAAPSLQVVLDADGVRRALRRMAREIVEQVGGTERLAIVGIHTGGVPLARRVVELIRADEGHPADSGRPGLGAIDISFYRDDLRSGRLPQPVVGRTELPFQMSGARVVLVDDVLFTGRTVRAALDALVDYGRPASIRLAVLVDRGHRELPIQADSVGVVVTTARHHSVSVELTEGGASEDCVVLINRPLPGGAP